jgi:hemerythrin
MPSYHRHQRPVPFHASENRRQSPRRPASVVPDLKARLFAGSDVHLVDVSPHGILIETNARLLPGSPISIKFVTADADLVLRGTVVRSSVSRVSGEGVVYRTAVGFADEIKPRLFGAAFHMVVAADLAPELPDAKPLAEAAPADDDGRLTNDNVRALPVGRRPVTEHPMSAQGHDDLQPTGITDIDREHALELRVVRETQAALLTGDRKKALLLLERLEDVTNAHFLTEQLLMRLHAYAGYAAHEQDHDRLIGELRTLSRALASDEPVDARLAVQQLERWLLTHMATEDQALGTFISQKPDATGESA